MSRQHDDQHNRENQFRHNDAYGDGEARHAALASRIA